MAIKPDRKTVYVLEEVLNERNRQFKKLNETNLWDCADPNTPWPNKVLCLAEELGEVSRDILEAGFADNFDQFKDHLKKECIQLAAVAVACAESLS